MEALSKTNCVLASTWCVLLFRCWRTAQWVETMKSSRSFQRQKPLAHVPRSEWVSERERELAHMRVKQAVWTVERANEWAVQANKGADEWMAQYSLRQFLNHLTHNAVVRSHEDVLCWIQPWCLCRGLLLQWLKMAISFLFFYWTKSREMLKIAVDAVDYFGMSRKRSKESGKEISSWLHVISLSKIGWWIVDSLLWFQSW